MTAWHERKRAADGCPVIILRRMRGLES